MRHNMEMKTESCSVYRATSPSGKRYYGVSQQVESRWWQHRRDAAQGVHRPLAKAIAKYGFEAMNFEILFTEYGEDARQKCLDAEVSLIAKDNTMVPNGYNVTAGGDGASGVKVSESLVQQRIAASKITRAAWSDEKKVVVTANRIRGQNKPELAKRRAELLAARWADPVEVARLLNRKADTTNNSEAAKKTWLTRDKTAIRALRSRAVTCVETGAQFSSVSAARDWLRETQNPKAVHGAIASAARGLLNSAYGYHWKYA
jgi:predicted GIY-YIG superfamily endonuclease